MLTLSTFGSLMLKVARHSAGQTIQRLFSSHGSAKIMQHSHYIRDAFAKQELREGHLMMVSPLAVCIVVVLVRNTTFASKDQQQIIVFFLLKDVAS